MRNLIPLFAACFLLLCIFVSPSSATSIGSTDTTVATASTRPTSYLTASPGNLTGVVYTVHQVSPPDIVYWGDTVDLQLVQGWYDMVVRLPQGNAVDVSIFTRKIYIDPGVFPTGIYYQWAPFEERAGNIVAFEVKQVRPAPTLLPTVENETAPVNETPVIKYTLPQRYVADILVARGDGFTYSNPAITNNTRIWVFGRISGVYGATPANGSFIMNATEVDNLEVGIYRVLLVTPGTMTVPKLVYNESEGQVRYEVPPPLDIHGYAPQVAYEKFKAWMQMYSDDTLTEITMEVQYPSIEIDMIDEISAGGIETSNLHIYGYTNVAEGSKVWCVWDEEKQNERTIGAVTVISEAYGSLPGDMREFHVILPLYYSDNAPGEHFITVHTTHDAFVRVSWWIYEVDAGTPTPLAHQRYSAGNLFVPTPAPEVIIKEVPVEVIREVVRYVTPEPTPAPTPPPVYFQSPWIIVIELVVVCVVVWIFWKYVL